MGCSGTTERSEGSARRVGLGEQRGRASRGCKALELRFAQVACAPVRVNPAESEHSLRSLGRVPLAALGDTNVRACKCAGIRASPGPSTGLKTGPSTASRERVSAPLGVQLTRHPGRPSGASPRASEVAPGGRRVEQLALASSSTVPELPAAGRGCESVRPPAVHRNASTPTARCTRCEPPRLIALSTSGRSRYARRR